MVAQTSIEASYCVLCDKDVVVPTEDNSKGSSEQYIYQLISCSHECCTECLRSWIERTEKKLKTTPTCPFCRKELFSEEIVQILGRPLQIDDDDAPHYVEDDEEEGSVDDLTQDFLNEYTRPCGRCGARIWKDEDSNDMMECLCGYRFCYNCGAENAACSCNSSNGYFPNNSGLGGGARRNGDDEEERVMAHVDPVTGVVDLAAHLRRKEIRDKRNRQRIDLASEERNMDELTRQAKWLFLPTYSASLRMLNHICGAQDQKRWERKDRRATARSEWTWYGGIATSGTWCFEVTSACASIQMLSDQLQERDDGRPFIDQYIWCARFQDDSSDPPSPKWLFEKGEYQNMSRRFNRLFQHLCNDNIKEAKYDASIARYYKSCYHQSLNDKCPECERKENEEQQTNAMNIQQIFTSNKT